MENLPQQKFSEGIIFLALLLVVICAGVVAGMLQITSSSILKESITDFTSCASAGYPIAESYPRSCRTNDGNIFIEEISPLVVPGYSGEHTNVPGESIPPREGVSDGSSPNTTVTPSEPSRAKDGCIIGGCSSQLCVDSGAPTMTTCEYTASYGCYRTATCERQRTGRCGWTNTAELTQCLNNPPELSEPVR
ncbi:MAG: hypothetical protein HGA67_00315 [Candidatus Yonathbacteria bacterium]|nr:hypothetical protein [Candidatus Yonathbacteria bacterium]